MRVLMLHNDYSQVGGEYFSVRAEHDALLSRGIEARLVTVDNADLLRERGKREFMVETITTATSRRIVSDAIESQRPDIVHAQNMFPLMGRGIVETIRQYKLPWVRSLRNYRLRCLAGTCYRDGKICTDCRSAATGAPGVLHACYRDSRAESVGALTYAWLESQAVRRYPPNAYIALSESMLPPLRDAVGSTPVYIKPNSVPPPSCAKIVPRSERDPEFLYVGRLSPEKGVDRLIRDFAAESTLRLAIAGDGTLEDQTQEIVDNCDRITLLGSLAHEEVMRRMRSALAVVVPSDWDEPFGRVAAEALANGTPPLVSARGGLRDVVENISRRFELSVTPTGNWADHAKTLSAFDQQEYDLLASACQRRWRSTYSEAVVGDQLVSIYEDVLSSIGDPK